MERITATAVRKAARQLGDGHPAVIEWQRVAAGRIARINNIDADPHRVAPLTLGLAALEAAKRRVIEAAGEDGLN